MPIRGENTLQGYNTSTKLSASIPLAIAAMQTSLAEATRGYSFEAIDLPFHDHAHEGSRIDRSLITNIDGGCIAPAMSLVPSTINDWYGLNPDGKSTPGIATFAGGEPISSVGPTTLGYSLTGLGTIELAISGARPAVIGKALVSLTGVGNGRFRVYCRESKSFVDSGWFTGAALQWINLSALTILNGLLNFEVYFQIDTLLDKIDIWSISLTETRNDTQLETSGSYVLGADPRP